MLGFRPLIILVLVLGIIAGLAFGGGMVIGSATRTSPTPAPAAAGGGAARGAAAGAGAAAGGARAGGGAAAGQRGSGTASSAGGAASAIDGTVASIQGATLTIRGFDGSTTQVSASPSTQVSTTVPAAVGDLKQGDVVNITPGQPNSSGQSTALSIVVLPARPTGRAGATPGARTSATPAARTSATPQR